MICTTTLFFSQSTKNAILKGGIVVGNITYHRSPHRKQAGTNEVATAGVFFNHLCLNCCWLISNQVVTFFILFFSFRCFIGDVLSTNFSFPALKEGGGRAINFSCTSLQNIRRFLLSRFIMCFCVFSPHLLYKMENFL